MAIFLQIPIAPVQNPEKKVRTPPVCKALHVAVIGVRLFAKEGGRPLGPKRQLRLDPARANIMRSGRHLTSMFSHVPSRLWSSGVMRNAKLLTLHGVQVSCPLACQGGARVWERLRFNTAHANIMRLGRHLTSVFSHVPSRLWSSGVMGNAKLLTPSRVQAASPFVCKR
jgi:hypothetical protein